ncbi:hypothetical protein MKX01_001285 [Papaver californicum]|nr:hypothetical protein MKX01_001285 [Papaver californicum]
MAVLIILRCVSNNASLILHNDAIPITANVQCESYWPSLFAKLAERKNIEDLITNAGGGAAAVEAPAVEEKRKEEKEESDDEDMDLFSIFD